VAATNVLRIAHAAGNRRDRLERALEAGVDMIEVDVRFRGGVAWVRHEHRLGVLPLLYNRRPNRVHREGPFALSVGPHFFRLDVRRLRLDEVAARVHGKAGLLVDLKAGAYRPAEAQRFVEAVLTVLDGFTGPLDFCGSWPLLDLVRAAKPGLPLHYSVDRPAQWAALQARMGGAAQPPGISLHPRLLTEERALALHAAGVEFYCWDVEDSAGAERVLALGAAGIIAGDLDLLRALAGRPVRLPGAA
jgi:glycerophosphoryl diester phosphodiesterase